MLAAFVLFALAAPPAPADAFRRAEDLYAADKFGDAEPLYKAALATDDPFLRRRTYTRLMNLYLRSGRPDKAVKLGETYRAWLKEKKDDEGLAALDVLDGESWLNLGYTSDADKRLVAALASAFLLPLDRRLEALRLRAEIATQRRDGTDKARWAELEAAAASASKDAKSVSDFGNRVTAGRYLSEARLRRGDPDGALAALADFTDLLDARTDPLGRRDALRQRATVLVAKGKYSDAAAAFKEALELHRKAQPKRRLGAGDILAEWSAAALASGDRAEATKLRDEAAVEYRAALDAPADDPDAGGPLAALVRLQSLTRSARQFRQALDVTVRAGERWSGDALVDARLKSDRGGLELMTAAYQTARGSLETALADLDAADPTNLRALPKVLVNLATAEIALDAPEKAEPLLKRVDALYRKHGLAPDPVRVEADYLSGAAAARRGEYAQAMAHFRAGLALCADVGKPADPVRFNLHLNVALLHKEQGDALAASDALKSAVDVLATFSEPDEASKALIDAVRADLFLSQGYVKPALALAPGIEAVCARAGQRTGYLWATARHVVALDHLARSPRDIAGAERVWSDLADGQRKEKSLLLPRTLNYLGTCCELRKDWDAARRYYEEADRFQIERPRCPPVTRAVTLWRLAALADLRGEKPEARKLIAQVFDAADKARLNTFGEAAQRAQFFAQFAPAFEMLAHWCNRDGDGELLLRTAVRSRSRTLLDQMLAAGIDPRERIGAENAALLKRETDARKAVSRLRTKVMLIPADGVDDPASKKLLDELEAAQKEYAAAWLEIANADPLTRVLTDPNFTDNAIARVRLAAQRSGGVLVVYFVGRDESFAVLSTDPTAAPRVFRLFVPKAIADEIGDLPPGDASARAGFRGVVLKPIAPQPARPADPPGPSVPLTEVVAARLANQYVRNVADPNFNPTRGVNLVSRKANVVNPSAPEVLGDAVLPPDLRAALKAAKPQRVVVVPDGALHKLPFECLLLSAAPKPVYLLDELPPVCYAPSVAALAVVLGREHKPASDGSLLTVGDPEYAGGAGALPRLPYTAVESERVRKSFAADQVTSLQTAAATEQKVVAAIPGKRFVHLAAHGFADEQFGNAFGAIALAPPPKGQDDPSNDGFLTMHEITRLKMTGCELTVLSACVTNVGPQRPMEAGVTLAGAFLGAGSRGVMASCWSVDDQATAELMSAFFGAIRPAAGKGAAYPDALKAARLKVRGMPGWDAPFFWAPFVYVGPPD